MKRINILLTLVLSAVTLSCSRPSLKDIAIERSKLYIKPYDRFVHEIYSGDSIYIINRSAVIKDDESEVGTQIEYYIMWTTGKNKRLVEYCFNLDKEESLIKSLCTYMDVTSNDRLLRDTATGRHRNLFKEVNY